MKILAIETSCDETSAAVVEDGTKIISNVIFSQGKIHSKYSGVVPELASRAHLEKVNWVIAEALGAGREPLAGRLSGVDAIAFTRGPGLMGSLLVGSTAARTLAWVSKKPLIGINHLEGHIMSVMPDNPGLKPPFVSLIVSGGHTELVYVRDFAKFKVMGKTRDDAAGECLDKAAKALGLKYPGGPEIERTAFGGDPAAVKFPRPYMWPGWEFSFSGLKTALIYYVKDHRDYRKRLKDICASFQQALIDTLVFKAVQAAKKMGTGKITLCGGVAANMCLREELSAAAKVSGIRAFFPSKILSTDNAAMIASAAYYRLRGGIKKRASAGQVDPNLEL
jgi:N6-L-threonylcarbamoyladenine synthase